MSDVSREFVSGNPGRDVQRVGTARFLGEDVAKMHDPVWGVIGTLGDSQCYLGVQAKVDRGPRPRWRSGSTTTTSRFV